MLEQDQKFRLSFRMQLSLGLGILIVAIVGICMSFYYTSIRDIVFYNYARQGELAVNLAADRIAGDDIQRYLQQGYIDEVFLEQNDAYFRDLKKRFGAKYFYLFVPEEDYLIYIYSAVNAGDDIYSKTEFGQRDVYLDKRQIQCVVESGMTQKVLDVNHDGSYGNIASIYAPVKDRNGKTVAVFAIDYAMDQIVKELKEDILEALFFIGMTVLLLSGFILTVQYRRMIKPVTQLLDSIKQATFNNDKEIAADSFHFEPIHIRVNNEFRDLAEAYNKMAGSIQMYIEQLAQVTTAKQAIETELNVAKNIQEMLLPHIFPPYTAEDTYSIYATIEAAKCVGGDYYDFYAIDDDHIGFTIADVSGKGVPAALFMVIAKTIMKNQALATARPDKILAGTNNQLNADNDEGMFVTAFTGVLELSTGRLLYANAGHNPPVLLKNDGSVEFLPVDRNIVLAILSDMEFSLQEMQLKKGDTLFLYTDGVTEAMDSEQNQYTESKMLECLKSCPVHIGLAELLRTVRRSIAAHVGAAEQSDDITMLAVRLDSCKEPLK